MHFACFKDDILYLLQNGAILNDQRFHYEIYLDCFYSFTIMKPTAFHLHEDQKCGSGQPGFAMFVLHVGIPMSVKFVAFICHQG